MTDVYERHVATPGHRERAATPADAWRMFAASARRSPAARRALRAFHERERLVRLAEGKLREAERILRAHPAEQAVVFCGGTDAAEAVSRELAIPMITASTPASERHALLAALARGDVRAVASVRVLDEGWDVPGAKLGIVLGDSTRGSGRQHVQRLGRLLRRQGDASRRCTRSSPPGRTSSSHRRSEERALGAYPKGSSALVSSTDAGRPC